MSDHNLIDQFAPKPNNESTTVFSGSVFDTVQDRLDLGHGDIVTRDYVRHPGAVVIMAIDDEGRILLQRQYRHPVGWELWEPPAGLLDVTGEDPLDAAKRELAEEADLTADTWSILVDFFTSPGYMDEAIRVYTARDLHTIPEDQRIPRCDEEKDLVPMWVSVDDACRAIFQGKIHNPSAVVGVLALASRARFDDIPNRDLRDPFPQKPAR